MRLNSQVIGVTLTDSTQPGTRVEIEIKPLKNPGPGEVRRCAFWDLQAGVWSTEGCRLVKHDTASGHDVCECTHLTHFGEIIGVAGKSVVLDVISIVGSILSLLGLLGIALTAIFFKQWRSRLGNKVSVVFT